MSASGSLYEPSSDDEDTMSSSSRIKSGVAAVCASRKNVNKTPVYIMDENIVDESEVRINNKRYMDIIINTTDDEATRTEKLLSIPRLVTNVPGCIMMIGSCVEMRLGLKVIADQCQYHSYGDTDLEYTMGDFLIRNCCGIYNSDTKMVSYFEYS